MSTVEKTGRKTAKPHLEVADGDVQRQRTLSELIEAVRASHEAARQSLADGLQYAIVCGDALNEIRSRFTTGSGEWTAMQVRLGLSRGTIVNYCRLAYYRDRIEDRDHGIWKAVESIQGLPDVASRGRPRSVSPADEAWAQEEFGSGRLTVRDVADTLGVPYQRAYAAIHPQYRERQAEAQRKRRRRRIAEKAAFRREAAATAAKGAGGPLAEGYSLTRRAAQQIDHARASADGEAKRRLEAALARLHEAEEEVTRALGIAA